MKVKVIYHHEDEGWWAVSPDLPDLVVAGDSQAEVRQLVEEGLDSGYEVEHLDAEDLPLAGTPRGRFLADLGRVSQPVLMVVGFRVENNQETESEGQSPVISRAEDVTYV